MPFEKGKSGNPGGRPARGKSFGDILEELLALQDDELTERFGTPMTKKEKLAFLIIEELLSGRTLNPRLLDFIANRLEGPLPQVSLKGDLPQLEETDLQEFLEYKRRKLLDGMETNSSSIGTTGPTDRDDTSETAQTDR